MLLQLLGKKLEEMEKQAEAIEGQDTDSKVGHSLSEPFSKHIPPICPGPTFYLTPMFYNTPTFYRNLAMFLNDPLLVCFGFLTKLHSR